MGDQIVHLPEFSTHDLQCPLLNALWSDSRTTYRLLPVGNGPDEPVEILVTGWPEIEMSHSRLHYPRVRLG